MARATGRRPLGPRLNSTWSLLAWMLVPLVALTAIGPVDETDVYWHIKVGEDILANGRFGGDPSWTYGPADAAWVTTQAASEVLLYLVYWIGSWSGLVAFRIVLGGLVALSVLTALTRVVGRRPDLAVARAVALVATITAASLVPYVQERPQTLSLLILPWIGLMSLRVMYADRWPRWWVVGLVVLVWSWFHGAAVLVGPLLAGAALIHALGSAGLKWLPVLIRSVRRGWLVVLVALVAPMLGPLGLGYYPQALKIQEAASNRIVEWMAPDANNGVFALALTLIVIWTISVVRLAASSGRIWRTFRIDMLFLILMVIVMSQAGRYLAVGAVLISPVVVRRLAQAWTRPSVRIERLGRRPAQIILAVVWLAVLVITALSIAHARPVARDRPLKIWTSLAEQPGERRAFVSYNLGGQAELLGEAVVNIDGRSDRYGGHRIDLIRDAVNGESNWEKVFNEYPGTTDVILGNGDQLLGILKTRGWKVACTDAGFTWLTAPGVSGSCS